MRYFKTGLDLLEENCWEAYYDLALALHTQTAEVAFLCSDTDEMEKVVRIVLQHARSPLDQAPVYEVKILALTAQNRWAEACRVGAGNPEKTGIEFADGTRQISNLAEPVEDKNFADRKILRPTVTAAAHGGTV